MDVPSLCTLVGPPQLRLPSHHPHWQWGAGQLPWVNRINMTLRLLASVVLAELITAFTKRA